MIRKMNESDMKDVLAIEEDLFGIEAWDNHQFLYELNENPFSQVMVYERDGEIIGYIDFWKTYEQAQISSLAVKRDEWRKGIGQELLDYCVEECSKECDFLSLEVRIDNESAIALYKKNDFIIAATRKNYYSDGTDAYLMVKGIGQDGMLTSD